MEHAKWVNEVASGQYKNEADTVKDTEEQNVRFWTKHDDKYLKLPVKEVDFIASWANDKK